MIQGHDIICHALPTWDGDYMKAVVQLMAQLARHNRVLYVNYAYTYKDLFNARLHGNTELEQLISGKNGRLHSRQKFPNGELFILYPPPVVPTNWIKSDAAYHKMQERQALRVGKEINKAMQQLHFQEPIVINAFNPQFGLPLLYHFNERMTLYYCYDEISAADWCKVHGPAVENAYMDKVEGVVVTSEGLYKSKSKVNANCFLVKNGVDHDLFATAMKEEISAQKTIGYIGSVDNRLDFDLLEAVAKNFENCKIKLIGRVTDDRAHALERQYANVQLTGAKQPKELAAELKEVDLGLIPFITNEFTKNVYPLKVNEYLAAGKAVVSTHFAPLHEFHEFISIAENREDFIAAMARELNNDSMEKRRARSAFAANNSWANRAEQFSTVIEDLLVLTSEDY